MASKRKKNIKKKCANCGQEFMTEKKDAKYCCRKCWNEGRTFIKEKECEFCGKLFHPQKKTSKYCCTECRDNARINHELRSCPVCGKKFKYFPDSKYHRLYCSKKCYDEAQKTIGYKVCEVCGKTYYPKRESSRFCSHECYLSTIRRDLKIVKCLNCGKEFQQKWEGHSYCCKECVWESTRNEDRVCVVCGKHFHTNCNAIYCSRECSGKVHSEYMKDKWDNATEEEKNERVEKFTCEGKEISKKNERYREYLETLGFETSLEFKLEGKGYDIKVGNTFIELNPSYTHNSTRGPIFKNGIGKPKETDYHYKKLKLAKDNGYRCIMVWDRDDETKIPYLLDGKKETIYARKCELKQITRDECHGFFETYHLQGDTQKNKNNVYIGLFYEGNLIECMSFGKPRFTNKYEREILRLCSHKDYKVVGGANRMFKKFLEIVHPNNVVSYCDMSKFDGTVYEQLGFKLLKWNSPSLHYYNEKEEPKKRHITYNLLKRVGFDKMFGEKHGKGTDNDFYMEQRGYVKIYDCGQSTFVWTKD